MSGFEKSPGIASTCFFVGLFSFFLTSPDPPQGSGDNVLNVNQIPMGVIF